MIAPTIETERLILTAASVDRFDEQLAIFADRRVVAYIGSGEPRSREEGWRRFAGGVGNWSLLGYGYWTILDRASLRVIGTGGFGRFERGIPELDGFPEAGWAFAADSWGKGIASEFLAAAVAWADAQGHAETRCIIAPANLPSVRVAEKNGFVRLGEVTNVLGTSLLFRRPAASAPDRG